MGETKPVQSVLRAVDLLEVLSEAPGGMRLSDIASALGLKLPTVHNLARTLASRGLVEKRANGLYAVGPGVFELARRVGQGRRLRAAEAAVRRLAMQASRPVVNYAVPSDTELTVRLRMSPDRPGIVQQPVHQRLSLYGSASGLAALAFMPPDRVALLRQEEPFHEYGIRLWKSLEQLDTFLEACRRRGCAVTPFAGQELFRVSAPVRDDQGVPTALLGAAVPMEDLDSAGQEALVAAVLAEAGRLSEAGEEEA